MKETTPGARGLANQKYLQKEKERSWTGWREVVGYLPSTTYPATYQLTTRKEIGRRSRFSIGVGCRGLSVYIPEEPECREAGSAGLTWFSKGTQFWLIRLDPPPWGPFVFQVSSTSTPSPRSSECTWYSSSPESREIRAPLQLASVSCHRLMEISYFHGEVWSMTNVTCGVFNCDFWE